MSRSHQFRKAFRHLASIRRGATGFTLIELMVTLAVMAILLALAVPSFQLASNVNRLAGGANEIMAGLQLARAEAIHRNVHVYFCRSDDSATCSTAAGAWVGWLVFADNNADGAPQAAEILRTETIATRLQVQPSASVTGLSNKIVFKADGMARDSGGSALLNGRIGICMPTTAPALNARDVMIGSGGRIAVLPNNQAGLCPTPVDAQT
jgi:type IV fimbrial biogenesis protein FimT